MGDSMKAAGEKEGIAVNVTSAELDPAKQKDQVKDFIVAKVSAIILTPADSKAIFTSIIEANQAGIPVFTADIASLSKGAKVVCHVATDNYGGGKEAAKAMIEALDGKGKVAIIDHPEVESGMLRTKGFEEEIAKAEGIKIVAKLPGRGARDQAFKVAEDILQAHPDVNGIFAINDPTALGVVAAIEKAGKLEQIKIVGFDGQPEAKQAIKQGKIYATVLQYPDKIAAMTIDAVVKYLEGDKVEPQILIPTGLYRRADARKDAALK
jgi:ribose transport system substrate-binding protein